MTALREVFKIGKGFDGWSTDLHNLCWAIQKGRPIYSQLSSLSIFQNK